MSQKRWIWTGVGKAVHVHDRAGGFQRVRERRAEAAALQVVGGQADRQVPLAPPHHHRGRPVAAGEVGHHGVVVAVLALRVIQGHDVVLQRVGGAEGVQLGLVRDMGEDALA
jgi:hypothetical protein